MSLARANKVHQAMGKLAAGKELTLEEKILTNTANREETTLYAQQFNAMAREANLTSGNPRRIQRQQEIDAEEAAKEAAKQRAFEQINFNQRASQEITWLSTGADISMRERVNRAALAEVDRRREILDYFAANPEALEAAREDIRRENRGIITPSQIDASIKKATSLEHISLSLEGGKFRAKSNSEGHIQVWPGGIGDGE